MSCWRNFNYIFKNNKWNIVECGEKIYKCQSLKNRLNNFKFIKLGLVIFFHFALWSSIEQWKWLFQDGRIQLFCCRSRVSSILSAIPPWIIKRGISYSRSFHGMLEKQFRYASWYTFSIIYLIYWITKN